MVCRCQTPSGFFQIWYLTNESQYFILMIFLSLYLLLLLTHNPPWCWTTVRPCKTVKPRTVFICIFSSSFLLILVFSFILRSADHHYFCGLLLWVNLLCMYTHFPCLPVHWCTSRHKGFCFRSGSDARLFWILRIVLKRRLCWSFFFQFKPCVRCSSRHQGFR